MNAPTEEQALEALIETGRKPKQFHLEIIASTIQVNAISLLVVGIVITGFFTISASSLATMGSWGVLFYIIFSVATLLAAMMGLLIAVFTKGRILTSPEIKESLEEIRKLTAMVMGFTLQIFIATIFLVLGTMVFFSQIPTLTTPILMPLPPFWTALGAGLTAIAYVAWIVVVNKTSHRFLLALTGDHDFPFAGLARKNLFGFMLMFLFPLVLLAMISVSLETPISGSPLDIVPPAVWQILSFLIPVVIIIILFYIALKRITI